MAKRNFKVFKGLGKGKQGSMNMLLFNVILILLCFGLIMCFSASAPSGQERYNDSYYFFKKQLYMAIAGFIAMLVMSKIDYHLLRKHLLPIIVVTFILLGLVFLFPPQKGGRRWITLMGFSFQPSELAKLTSIIWFASRLSRQKWHKAKNVKEFFKTFLTDYLGYIIIIGIFAILLMLEPHFSCTLLIGGTLVIMLFVAGSNIGHSLMLGGAALPVVILLAFQGYRGDRLASFIDPFSDPRGEGYQIIQSLYAVGSGGLFGLGLGQSRQKFLWLPEPYNDFIFAVICEELGFIGALAVIVLFAILIWRGFYISKYAPDKFGSFLALGITTLMALQVLINIAVVTKVIPVTGMQLPLFSSGGTAIFFTLVELGILLNISRQIDVPEAKATHKHI